MSDYLNHNDIKRMIQARRYKPGWDLQTVLDPFEGTKLRVTARMANPRDLEGVTVDVVRSIPIPPMPDLDYLDIWIIWQLGMIELHAVRDYYQSRVDNRPVIDPPDPCKL